MADENSTGNNLIWAITMLIVVAIIAGTLYFLVLKSDNTPKINKTEVELKVR